jgi:plastocyanin
MKFRNFIPAVSIPLLATAIALAADAPSTQPAAAPTTQPATYSIHGVVSAGDGFSFEKPDLGRVAVYLDSTPALDAASLPADRPQVAQINKAFVPNFLIIPKGADVEFPNWDHIAHNVFSRSAAAPAFDLDRYPYGQSKTRKFEKVGVVQIFCNVHPFMHAIIVVTPNIYFARCSDDGHFQIDGLPAGQYQISAWQERCATVHQTIDVGPGHDQDITFTLAEDHDSIIANDPPRHGDNYGVDRGLGLKREPLNLPVVQDSHPAPTSAPSNSTGN